jgi:predicted transcriptional regulator
LISLKEEGMAELKNIDPFVSTEREVEVDAETAAAIEEGLKDANEGRVVPASEVHKLIPQWISRFSTPKQP